jgi:DNA-binding winged helix-turn-helix (wHTH) protein
MKADAIYQFGKLRIDALARTLRREGTVVTLNRRAFDVLLYFVQSPGRVLTRDELLKNVWPDTCVDENSLAQSISVLRRALEENQKLFGVYPRRGYGLNIFKRTRFVPSTKTKTRNALVRIMGAHLLPEPRVQFQLCT